MGFNYRKATEQLRGHSILFTSKFPEIPATHWINLRRMEDSVDLGAIQWFCGDHVYIYEKWHSEFKKKKVSKLLVEWF